MTNSSLGSDDASPKAKRSKSPTKNLEATTKAASPRPELVIAKAMSKTKALWDLRLSRTFPPRLPDDPFECAVTSCPELCPRLNDASSGYFAPRPRRSSRSSPPTPSSLSRLAVRFRSARVWRSIGRSSFNRPPPRQLDVTPRYIDGKERRRRAREDTVAQGSAEAPGSQCASPRDEVAASPLVMAGVMLAMERLDRLSGRARSEGKEEASEGQV